MSTKREREEQQWRQNIEGNRSAAGAFLSQLNSPPRAMEDQQNKDEKDEVVVTENRPSEAPKSVGEVEAPAEVVKSPTEEKPEPSIEGFGVNSDALKKMFGHIQKPNNKSRTFYIEEELVEMMDALIQAKPELKRSTIVNEALRKYLHPLFKRS